MKYFTLCITLFTAIFLNISAQSIVVEGMVVDESFTPLPAVNIILKNSTIGAVTDIYGRFLLHDLSEGDTLVFSYIGFLPEVVKIDTNSTFLNITLIEDAFAMEEVLCVGYGSVARSCVTGAISSFSSGRHHSRRRAKSSPTVYIRGTSSIYGSSIGESINPGLLTAGEVNDFSKWELWNDISENELKNYQKIWKMKPSERYMVQLTTENGFPVINASVNLIDNEGLMYWSARTDNTGKAELWYNAFQDDPICEKFSAQIHYGGNIYSIRRLQKFAKGVNSRVVPVENKIPNKVDIAFVVDATGSMIDEINYLKTELSDIMHRIRDTLPDIDLRLGCVFYRDHGDEYVTRHAMLSSDYKDAISFVNNNTADGGGDGPEAVEEALSTTLERLNWSEEARARIVFLVLDAPPHERQKDINKINYLIGKASEMGIRVVPLTCSGINKSTEYLMRSIALFTNGTYTFLTDDSGIGNPHIKPTTDEYNVELLNNLFIRLIFQYTHVPNVQNVLSDSIAFDTLCVYKPQTLTVDISKDIDTAKADTDIGDIFAHQNSLPEIAWKYYPNPTRGLVYFESEIDIGELFVNDLSGKILERYILDGNRQITLDLSNYPKGIYFITYEYMPDRFVRGKVLLI